MLMGHMGVTNDGNVHYHPVPNLSFASAIDLVKELIDIFPDDFTGSGAGHDAAHGHTGRGRATSGKSKSGKK
jgi:hypothetical protein